MKTYLKLELKRSVLSIRTLISILILVIPFAITSLEEFQYINNYQDGLDEFFYIYESNYIPYILPLVCVIYSATVVRDRKSGFLNKLLEIIDIKSYIKGKLIVNAVVNTFIIIISYGIFAVCFIALLGIWDTGAGGIHGGAYIVHGFSRVYYFNKLAYFLVVSMMTIISAITFSSFVLVITLMTNKKCTPYLVTIFSIVFTEIFMGIYGLNSVVNFDIMLQFWIVTNGRSAIGLVVYDAVLVGASWLLLQLYYKKIKENKCLQILE